MNNITLGGYFLEGTPGVERLEIRRVMTLESSSC